MDYECLGKVEDPLPGCEIYLYKAGQPIDFPTGIVADPDSGPGSVLRVEHIIFVRTTDTDNWLIFPSDGAGKPLSLQNMSGKNNWNHSVHHIAAADFFNRFN